MMRRGERHTDHAARRRWRFTASERRGVLLLLPLLALLVWLVTATVAPRADRSAQLLGDRLVEGRAADDDAPATAREPEAIRMAVFDPNEVTYEELRRMGVPKRTAVGIVKYRVAGKVFAVPEDFALCYGVTDSMYAQLKPYIVIGEAYRLQPRWASGARTVAADREAQPSVTTAAEPFDPNTLDAAGFEALGFSRRQAEAIVRFREARGGFRTAEEFAESYVVSEAMFDRLRDRIVIAPSSDPVPVRAERHAVRVELNGADSAALDGVPGIGPATAAAVIAYRERLGGYCDPAQVLETGIVTEQNWERMREQIWADSCKIRKIDINFATPNAVADHPYIAPRTLRKILRNRQLKGGWSTIEDMIEDHTVTTQEAARLAPYLHFGAAPREN